MSAAPKITPRADEMTATERHELRVSALLVRISAAQKRMAENFAVMAERLVEMSEAQADAHKAIDELTKLTKQP